MPTSDPRLYRQVVNDIARRIADGDLKPGDRLPARRTMADQYDVSVSTIDRALTVLYDRGLLRGHQGKAMWIAEPTIETDDQA